MKRTEGTPHGLLKSMKEVVTQSDSYLAIRRFIQPVHANILSRLTIRQNHAEDKIMPNLKTITMTFHINEETGKIVNVTRPDGKPGEYRAPQGTITDSQSLVVARNSPTCIYYQIDGVWYMYCY
jgi:hypothetical protein